jgi:hypothetical protein
MLVTRMGSKSIVSRVYRSFVDGAPKDVAPHTGCEGKGWHRTALQGAFQ